ncbi:L-amino-acid oxidase-like [Mercenaria mercenaria]|uniref:L-amino-acid oxidase-like n=1 Tax=Mercenaria mercenaria TaxID=6596 RepID=UPI00234F0EB1|nr:L-amino-acid oxidase-like [Mercenaria mercenaria]
MSKCDDIAIIGAGITGSYSAWRLRKKNLKISLYEYSNRIGGRCFTVQLPGIPDVNVEMGAMRFKPEEHELVNQVVDKLGLEVVDFELGEGPSEDSLYYLRGKHMQYNELATHSPYNLPPEYRVPISTLNWKVSNDFTVSSKNGDVIKSLDGVDLYKQSRDWYYAKYLDKETESFVKDSDSWVSGHGPDVAAVESIPVSDPSLSSPGPEPVKTIKEGFQAIPTGLVEQFLEASKKHNFYYNHHLRSLKRHKNRNYVLTFKPTTTTDGITTDIKVTRRHYGCHGNNLSSLLCTNGVVTTCAKKVILAFPRLALEHLDWEGFRQKTVEDYLKYAVKDAPASKIFFGYDKPWWRDLPLASKFAVSTTPLKQSMDFDTRVWREALRSGETVQGVGDNSIAMSSDGVYLARKYYAEVFNVSLADVPEPDSAVMSIWDQYPIGAAWYAWAPGYKWDKVQARMLKPSTEDEVYIASNVFSSASYWIQGGMEKVEEVLKYFE